MCFFSSSESSLYPSFVIRATSKLSPLAESLFIAESIALTTIGTDSFTFTVSSDPGSAPVIDLVAHPVLGQIGPVRGTGVGVQSYDLTASLEQQ